MSARNGYASGRWRSLWARLTGQKFDLAAYRRLALQLHYDLPRDEALRSVLVVSATRTPLVSPGTATLATCLAEELHHPVLLADPAPRSQGVSRLLSCEERPGFSELLAGPELGLDDVVLPTNRDNLSFLPAGRPRGDTRPVPPEELGALVRRLEERFDFVLLSGGAVLEDSTVLALVAHVGCVLLVAEENATRVEDLDAARQALAHCRARRVGLLLSTPLPPSHHH